MAKNINLNGFNNATNTAFNNLIGKPETKEAEQPKEKSVKAQQVKKETRGRPRKETTQRNGAGVGCREGYTRKTFIIQEKAVESLINIAKIKRESIQDCLSSIILDYVNNFDYEKWEKKEAEKVKKLLGGAKK